MKKIIEKILASLAKKILKKYNPEIIGITGSVGKTSTKEAVFAVLKDNFNVRQNIKNYNTELGVPLTIINAESGGKNIFKWLRVILKGWKLILFKNNSYPKILILEMAADHPCDIFYLTHLAPCNIGVVTAIGPAHLEFFGNIEKIIKEKEILVTHLKKDGWAILNADDDLVRPMTDNTQAKVLSYGLSDKAQIKASEVKYTDITDSNGFVRKEMKAGIRCKITLCHSELVSESRGQQIMAEFKNILSISQLSSLLAAMAVAKIYKINLQEAVNNLKDFKFPKGRLQLILGIKNTLIIDDTYNSSPKAVKVTLEVLSRMQCKGRRWAVLGDMLELGSFTQDAHKQVGEWIKQYKIDNLVTVGERARDIAQIAEIDGLSKESVVSFDNSIDAGKFIQNEISQGDLILVKGSQGVRMEKIVKEIMAEPMKAEQLLVRQSKEWTKK